MTVMNRRSFMLGTATLFITPFEQLNLNDLALTDTAKQSQKLRFQENVILVNEKNQVEILLIDDNGNPVTDAQVDSDRPDVAIVERNASVSGLQRGVAVLTARRGNDIALAFVVVARVEQGPGVGSLGDQKRTTTGKFFITDPFKYVLYLKETLNAPAMVFSGKFGVSGSKDGERTTALFGGPTAIAIDNNPKGGIYIVDTLNNGIRKIGFDNQVTTILSGPVGTMSAETTPFDQARFRAPRGLVVDINGNLFIADTGNSVIYYADFQTKELKLVAGLPGVSGLQDGVGQGARFKTPTALDLSTDGRILNVIDGNYVRQITRDGQVRTLRSTRPTQKVIEDGNGVVFNSPTAIASDETGTLYLAEDVGDVKVVIFEQNQLDQVFSLAQPGTFVKPTGLVVAKEGVYVQDSGKDEVKSVQLISFEPPTITMLSQPSDRLEGGAEVVVTGANFEPAALVLLAGTLVPAVIETSTRLRFVVPPQKASGLTSLILQTRGGIAQFPFLILPKPVSELAQGQITSLVGNTTFVPGTTDQVTLSQPRHISVDPAGNIFIVNSLGNIITWVGQFGMVSPFAGTGRAFGQEGNLLLTRPLREPYAFLVSRNGNYFIATLGRIFVVDRKTLTISVYAGTGEVGSATEGSLATEVRLRQVTALAENSEGDLFVLSANDHRILRIDKTTKIVTIYAGTGTSGYSGDGGPASKAELNLVLNDFAGGSLLFDQFDNLFFSDSANHVIRRIDASTNTISTVVGTGKAEAGQDGPASSFGLTFPVGLVSDQAGNVLFADGFNGRIGKLDVVEKSVKVIVDRATRRADEQTPPIGVIFSLHQDGDGNLIFSDLRTNRILRWDIDTNTVRSLIGNTPQLNDNQQAIAGVLNLPFDAVVDQAGSIYIADYGNNRIRKIDSGGMISSILEIEGPTSLVVDRAQNLLYISQRVANRIHRFDLKTGSLTVVAGTGEQGFTPDGAIAAEVAIWAPAGLALDKRGNLFFSETGSSRIRQVEIRTGKLSSVAGNGQRGFSGDGGLATTASLNLAQDFLSGIFVDPKTGDLFICDGQNHRLRKVSIRTGIISTVAGNGGLETVEGSEAIQTGLNVPRQVLIDRKGTIFLVCSNSSRVFKIDRRTRQIFTLAGTSQPGFEGDGGMATQARFYLPMGASLNAEGDLILADCFNNALRLVKKIGVPPKF